MKPLEYLIIGAGPAGLQMAWFLARRGEPYLVLERAGLPGAFFERFPRHRKLLSINKVYTGYDDLDSRLRYDWNSLLCDDEQLRFPRYTASYFPAADVLVRYLGDFARAHRLRIAKHSEVVRVARGRDGVFHVTTTKRDYAARRLIVATGLSLPHVPKFPGVELCEHYATADLDPARFRDRRVAIVGKGNSAFETAESLTEVTRKIQMIGPHPLRYAWNTHFVGDLRAVNNNFLDTYYLKTQNNVIDGEIARVTRASDASLRVELRRPARSLTTDRVVLCTGFRFDASIFDRSCQPALLPSGRLPAMTSRFESTNVPDLYFIGTLMQSRDYKKTMSSFIHGFRFNIEALDQILAGRYRGEPWRRQRRLSRRPGDLAAAVIERVSSGAGIFLQPGFLCDVIAVEDGSDQVDYLEEVPVDYVHDSLRAHGGRRRYFLVTLEFADHDRPGPPSDRPGEDEDDYIHPVIRCYRGAARTPHQRFALPDHLDNDWRGEAAHARLLGRFFRRELEASPRAVASRA